MATTFLTFKTTNVYFTVGNELDEIHDTRRTES